MEAKPKGRPDPNLLLLGGSVLALLLVVAGALHSRGAGREVLVPEQAAVLAADSAPTLEVPAERSGAARAAIASAAPQVLEPFEATPPEPLEYPVSGHFILTDCSGRELTTLDGQFELITRLNGERKTQPVPIRRGSFSFTVPNPSDFFVHDLELTGREVRLDIEKELTGPHEDQKMILTAHDQCGVRLEVVDDSTGAQLTGLEIWSEGELDSSTRAIPATEGCDHIAGAETSPVFLPEVDLDWGTIRTYWVRAEGYTWGKVSVDHTSSGDHKLRLHPAGALHVRVEGLERARMGGVHAWLNLWSLEDNELLAYAQLKPSFTHRWEAVRPGAYRVSVDLGDHWDDPLPLGAARVELTSSVEAKLVIEASPPEIPLGPVRVSGVVRAHEYWREEGLSLGFHGLGETERWEGVRPSLSASELRPDPSDPGILHWTKELPCEGAWQVTVGRIGIHKDFNASMINTPLVEVTVPDPAQLSIQVRDATTGHVLPSIGVGYRYLDRTLHQGIVWPSLDYRPGSGTHSMAMPAGRVALRIYCEGYTGIEEERDLAIGEHELSYQLEPCARVDLKFLDGSTTIPMSLFDVELEVSPLEGEGEVSEVWLQGLVFSQPGAYRVRFLGLAGYRDAETTLTVPQRGVVSHPVQLMRE